MLKPGESTRDVLEMVEVIVGDDQEFWAAVKTAAECNEVAMNLRSTRLERGLTQSALAELAGVSKSIIARIEQKGIDSVSVQSLRKIATALGLRLEIGMHPPQSTRQ